jgi:hypothetical protein
MEEPFFMRDHFRPRSFQKVQFPSIVKQTDAEVMSSEFRAPDRHLVIQNAIKSSAS